MSRSLKMYVLLCGCLFFVSLTWAQPGQMRDAASSPANTLNVLDFGARGDGKTDDTAAFQKALDAAGKGDLGGTAFAPRGAYLIAGHLSIPKNVTLEGIWNIPTAWTQYQGTTLLAVEGEGDPNGPPFITLWCNSVIKGITVFYPNQVKTNPPKSYPWCIAAGGADNPSIIDVLLVNPYQAVDFGTHVSGRHYIRNLYGQPLFKGLYIDQCYDVGRVENVHFWPFWTCNNEELKPVQDFVIANGEAFIFGRTDWEYVYNTFCWGYKIGYHFIKTPSGMTNGNFLGIGADATNRAILVDDCAPYGLLITNGEFVSMFGPDPVSVEIKDSNTGVIQFQNCAFWGPSSQIATIKGIGTTMFTSCNFVFWDQAQKKLPALECFNGNLIVNSCNFNRPGHHILLHPDVASAVISGNRFSGKIRITNNSSGDVQIGLNTQAISRKEEPGAIVIDDMSLSDNIRFEGEWHEGQGGRDYEGITHWAFKGDGKCKAFFIPDLKEAGVYQVYLWYGGDPVNDHATDARFTIRHSQGSKTVVVNFKEKFGQWNLLGEFEFEKGRTGHVMLTNDANNQVIADAVKFVPKK